jgi:hypothetical protein
MPQTPNGPDDPSAQPPPARQPYEPPAITSEEVFETLAAACGKSEPRCAFTGGRQS